MKISLYFLLYFFLLSLSGRAQESSIPFDSVQHLQPVNISNNRLEDFSVGQTLNRLSDSIIGRNQPRLTVLLEYNTPIYFKENGLGMVSSPSFRGTTAAQTAVLWNGININSNFVGQTDFNTVNTAGYDEVDVRAGGGSVAFGSGAIGGTVHLNTKLLFQNNVHHNLSVGYGSFNTLDARYKLKASTKETSLRLSIARNSSKNNYNLEKRGFKNTNGGYHNTSVNLAAGWKINTDNQVNIYSEYYHADRHFPILSQTATRTKYKDQNLRSLLEWDSRFGAFSSSLKGAFLSEHFKYYPKISNKRHSYGKAETFLTQYDLNYRPINSVLLDGIISYKHINGFGSDIQHKIRNITSFGLLFKQQVFERLRYQAGVRKEVTKFYESPVLYSFGVEYRPVDFYTAKFSASRNFRRPTYNDLFWIQGGNPNLRPEKSDQMELGNTFRYRNLSLTLTGYFNDIRDMIHWLPAGGGISSPKNEDHVYTYGIESVVAWYKRFNGQTLRVNGTYAYTLSRNQKTGQQLIYTPYHKVTFSMAYAWQRIEANYQLLYNGPVYLHTDNDPNYVLGGYMLSNIGASYSFGHRKNYKMGVMIRNLFDKAYQNVLGYELPGINFNVYFNLNF